MDSAGPVSMPWVGPGAFAGGMQPNYIDLTVRRHDRAREETESNALALVGGGYYNDAAEALNGGWESFRILGPRHSLRFFCMGVTVSLLRGNMHRFLFFQYGCRKYRATAGLSPEEDEGVERFIATTNALFAEVKEGRAVDPGRFSWVVPGADERVGFRSLEEAFADRGEGGGESE